MSWVQSEHIVRQVNSLSRYLPPTAITPIAAGENFAGLDANAANEASGQGSKYRQQKRIIEQARAKQEAERKAKAAAAKRDKAIRDATQKPN